MPWIDLECLDGRRKTLSLEDVLLQAQELATIDDSSPLASVGIHRLLAAIIQDILCPNVTADIATIWFSGSFSGDKIAAFGRQYAGRFDLFSVDYPFLQTADSPIDATRLPRANLKTVAYLTPEIPATSGVTHYRHAYDDEHRFCPACAAKGLVMIPAFATSGGAGIKPSINGVPPIYVIPGGETLFHSLALSLVANAFQPDIAAAEDMPWWRRESIVPRGREVLEVGYLQSLTFAARRVRLHPERTAGDCTRCGRASELGVSTMVYEMGESRPRDSAVWFDPFVAYRLPKDGKKTQPTPVRPQEGRIQWRDYAALFLHRGHVRAKRPAILDQLDELTEQYDIADPDLPYPFRCVGIRSDGRMKMFEWEESGYSVPPTLLHDLAAADAVQTAIDRAETVEGILFSVFRKKFGGSGKEQSRHAALRTEMIGAFWRDLAHPFRELTLGLLDNQAREAVDDGWLDTVIRTAGRVFMQAADALGDNAANLRLRVEGEVYLRGALKAFANKERGVSTDERN
jgi:CRISPR system Cascade subunit CasA